MELEVVWYVCMP